jgi:hypothetical protein
VVFSLERALQPTSDMKSLITFIDKVIRVDDHKRCALSRPKG